MKPEPRRPLQRGRLSIIVDRYGVRVFKSLENRAYLSSGTCIVDALPWSETYAVGHPELDEEHHRMVDLINWSCRACVENQAPDALLAVLQELEALTETHFAHEERLLEEIQTRIPVGRRSLRETVQAAQVSHATEQRARLAELRDVVQSLHSDDVGGVSGLCEHLKGWFVDHAIRDEADVKTILQSI